MSSLTNTTPATRRTQHGAILVTSLLLLLVLTIIGITAMQMTQMQERMAGSTRDVNLAFQGAEAALRDGEALIRRQIARPIGCVTAPCDFWSDGILPDPSQRGDPWWNVNALELEPDGDRTTTTQDMPELNADPRFIVESLPVVSDTLTVGHEAPAVKDVYRVTGRSTGGSGNARTVLESTFTRRY
ncbi:MAG: hypothetical protein KDI32_06825 [Pseudomonadales bacterium]|jgi:type IV pilus assembly protein PilX|nr:hypothetical protein [Pseudomonadales bacterium]